MKTIINHFQTLLIDLRDHVGFGRQKGIAMTEGNVGIDICFKIIRYCISIWRRFIKINVHWSIDSCQIIIFSCSKLSRVVF